MEYEINEDENNEVRKIKKDSTSHKQYVSNTK